MIFFGQNCVIQAIVDPQGQPCQRKQTSRSLRHRGLNFNFHYELELLDLQFVHSPYHFLFAIQTCIWSK